MPKINRQRYAQLHIQRLNVNEHQNNSSQKEGKNELNERERYEDIEP